MAESKNNMVVHGFSGKLGDMLVFRQKAGKTFAAKAPASPLGPGTEGQQNVRERFQRAVLYGKLVTGDPATKEAYKAAAPAGQSAYNVAIADFFQAPDINKIDVSAYTGSPGQPIKVTVTDDFKVKAVRIAIHNEDGTLVEQGDAVMEANQLEWTYTSTVSNESIIAIGLW